MLNLVDSLKALWSGGRDLDAPNALFMTNLPWIDPGAYLNVIYKPVAQAFVDTVAEDLGFPNSLREFFKHHNGARLFFDAMRIYGCVHRETILDRSAPLTLPPFDIVAANREFQSYGQKANVVFIGSYSYDRSMVCMNRGDESIVCFKGADFTQPRRKWPSIEDWLRKETSRLSSMFAADGKREVGEELLLPSAVQ